MHPPCTFKRRVGGLPGIVHSDTMHPPCAAPSTINAGGAINQIVEDATQCKFESTNNSQDEIVLLNIVQVRHGAWGESVGTGLQKRP